MALGGSRTEARGRPAEPTGRQMVSPWYCHCSRQCPGTEPASWFLPVFGASPKQLPFGSAAGGTAGKTGAVVLSLRVPREQGRREGVWVQGTGSRSRVPSVCTSSLPHLHVAAVSMEPGRSSLNRERALFSPKVGGGA